MPTDATVPSPSMLVLTGGPGAGKTAVLDLLRHELCPHVAILPEAAGIVFGGGFPRDPAASVRRAAQRAIYHVQFELEAAFAARGPRLMLCDRGLVDGAAYWPGPDEFFATFGTSREALIRRYARVVHLRVPPDGNGYGHRNPLRTESAAEAREIDDRILRLWDGHPDRIVIEASTEFVDKAHRAIMAIRPALPHCCDKHLHRPHTEAA